MQTSVGIATSITSYGSGEKFNLKSFIELVHTNNNVGM